MILVSFFVVGIWGLSFALVKCKIKTIESAITNIHPPKLLEPDFIALRAIKKLPRAEVVNNIINNILIVVIFNPFPKRRVNELFLLCE